jgi:hypothetical protein
MMKLTLGYVTQHPTVCDQLETSYNWGQTTFELTYPINPPKPSSHYLGNYIGNHLRIIGNLVCNGSGCYVCRLRLLVVTK